MTDEPQGATPETPAKTQITSITQLQKRQVFNVDIDLLDGTILTFPMRNLKQGEWEKIGRDVPNPSPRSYGGVNGTTYDTADPDYRAKMNEADGERNLRRLAASLMIDIPGEDVAAKAHYLSNELDTSVFGALIKGFWKVQGNRGADIDSREAAFQP